MAPVFTPELACHKLSLTFPIFLMPFSAWTTSALSRHRSRADASLYELAGCKAFGVQRFCTGVTGDNKRVKKGAGSKTLCWQVFSMRVPTRSILRSRLPFRPLAEHTAVLTALLSPNRILAGASSFRGAVAETVAAEY